MSNNKKIRPSAKGRVAIEYPTQKKQSDGPGCEKIPATAIRELQNQMDCIFKCSPYFPIIRKGSSKFGFRMRIDCASFNRLMF